MRDMSQRTWRTLREIRERAERLRNGGWTPDEMRREAAGRLAAMDYVGKPIEVGAELAERLRQ